MTRWMIAIGMVLGLGGLGGLGGRAAADPDPDALYQCHVATGKLSASFRPDTSLQDLATWVTGFTCKNVIFSADVARHATRVTVISPNQMSPKQALQLFVDAVEATGLVVAQKHDSIIISLGAGMPKGCPDVGGSGGVSGVLAPNPYAPIAAPVEAELTDAELDAGIHAVDATHRTITRALVDKILANPMAIAKGARLVPWIKDSNANGFKIYAIRPGSLYARLGLQNGDAIATINGFALTDADKALEVYVKLRDATAIELALLRRGANVTLDITIK